MFPRDGHALADEGLARLEDAVRAAPDVLGFEELEIGVRAYNCLKRAGVQTMGDLTQKSYSELTAIPNFGERSIEEVVEALNQLGLSLREE